MDVTPNYAFPFAQGTDPRRDFPAVVNEPATTAIDAELARIDARTDAANRAIRYLVHTATTDPTNGFFSLSAAALGLTTLEGGIASLSWGLAANNAHWATARVSSNTLQVLVFGVLSNLDNGNVGRIKNTSVTVYIVAWGQE